MENGLPENEVTLFFDMVQEDDGGIYQVFSGNMRQVERLKQKRVIPESSSLAHASGLLLMAALWRRRKST